MADTALLASAPGTVCAFEMSATVGQVSYPAEIKDPELIKLRPSLIIFSSMEWRQETHQQFAHSLDGSVYVYVFGDQMGDVVMTGIAFDKLCGKEGSNGLQQVLEYYETNRASRRPSPISVSVASKIVQGFLTSVSVRAIGAALSPTPVMHEYTLRINALP